MAYAVDFTPLAAAQVRALPSAAQVRIVDQSLRLLSVNPALESKSRIKKLRDNVFPPYRLRVDDYRVFYSIDEASQRVIIYGVVTKSEANSWLATSTEQHSDENT